jgi:hypothetical protein
MKMQRLLITLSGLNLLLLLFLLGQIRPAAAQDIAPVLRGRALEIVDQQGRVRASITSYANIVVFRLQDVNGKPTVKLETHEAGFDGGPKGSGLGLLGDSDNTQAYIGTAGSISKVELKDKEGQRQLITP